MVKNFKKKWQIIPRNKIVHVFRMTTANTQTRTFNKNKFLGTPPHVSFSVKDRFNGALYPSISPSYFSNNPAAVPVIAETISVA